MRSPGNSGSAARASSKPAVRVPARRAELGCSLLLFATISSYVFSVLLAAIGLGAAAPVLFGLATLGVLLAWPVMALFQQSMIVGDDGVQLRNFMRSRYVPYNEVRSIEYYPGGWGKILEAVPYQLLVMRLYNGQTIMAWGFRPRIEQAFLDSKLRHGQYAQRVEVEVPAELRGGRHESGSRIRTLRGLANKEAGLRIAAVDTQDYLAVATSPRAEPQDRLAATIALVQGADPAELQRLRIAAESCALPELRTAMGLCLADRDAEASLALAIEELEFSYGQQRRGGST